MSVRKSLRLTLVFSFISSFGILLIPMMKNAVDTRAVVVPLVFWAGLIAEQITFVWFKKGVSDKKQKNKRFGVISFFKCKEGKAADVVFAVSAVALTAAVLIQKDESLLQYILIFAMLLSFRYHAVFNGYYYLNWKQVSQRRQKEEISSEQDT